jgi:hypothetical protein
VTLKTKNTISLLQKLFVTGIRELAKWKENRESAYCLRMRIEFLMIALRTAQEHFS